MTATSAPAWRLTGLIWTGQGTEQGVSLGWLSPVGETRASTLGLGVRLALVVGPDRRCIGVWHQGRRLPCATSTPIDPAATTGQCPSCAAMAKSRSVATDTHLDDPRDYSVYLAHHGYAIKVGITATERGHTRLLEQGALSATVLSTGSLVSARRCEALLSTALGLPQQVNTARKRQARVDPGTATERAAELRETTERARALSWPAGQAFDASEPMDLAAAYGLGPDGIRPTHAVAPLAPGRAIVGDVACRIGRDVYLDTPEGLVLLDSGHLQGWALTRADDAAALTASLIPLTLRKEVEQDALF